MKNSAGTNRGRVITLFWLFAGFACVLGARLVKLQWVDHDKYLSRADAQHLGEAELPAIRGEIRDRNNVVLATSIARWSVAVNPEVIAAKRSRDKAVDSLAMILKMKPDTVREVVERPGTFGWVSRKVRDAEAKKIRELAMEGVFLVKEPTPGKRYYPKGNLASHLMGTTGVDDQGLDGLEGAYEMSLRGRPGLLRAFMDRDGWATLEHPTALIRPAEVGNNVILTIDETIQYVAERELAKQVKDFNAEGGIVLVMDARNADILAMAINPTFAAQDFGKVKPETRRNRAITDPYEPGSTFKVFLAAAAINSGFSPTDMFASSGVLSFGGWVIQNANDGLDAGGTETIKDIIAYSFNVGTSNLAFALGKEKFSKHLDGFGFGYLTGIDLVGESEGILAPVKDWEKLNLATISFGQGVAVTPIQLVSGMQAIVNGGIRMKPRVVQAITDHDGKIVERYEPEEIGRPITPDTSKKMLDILENVCEKGTGKRARIPGYRVGGKTGTAQLVENGVYADGDYVASFLGVAPIDDPRIVVLIKIEKPQPYWGGVVAAPVFNRVAEKALWKLGVKPDPKHAKRDLDAVTH
jgi:stage V sporulation protein D (sporulation-specific penicillin-binding protein)